MTLPTFLGIGVPRAGTTWLYNLLSSHPNVYMSERRKEIHFFDHYYERGIDWYEQFFPSEDEAAAYVALGEFTPQYLYRDRCAERIAATLSDPKLIVMLRNPVDRAYSHYRYAVQVSNYGGSFEEYVSHCPEVIQYGFYSRGLEEYFAYFTKEQLLVLIFEQAVADTEKTKQVLSRFLEIVPDRFPSSIGGESVNESYLPKRRAAYALAVRTAYVLRRKLGLDWLIDFVDNLGVKRLFGKADSFPPMKKEPKIYLEKVYEHEVSDLEYLLETDLGCWR